MAVRFAAVHLWALPLEVVHASTTTAWDPSVPSAVRREVRGRYVLQATSPGAQQLGIRPGVTQSEARARRPDLQICDRDASAEQRELERVAELLFAFGPVVEVCGPDLLFVEVGRSQRALARRLGKDYTETTLAQAILHALEKAGHIASVTICGDPETGRTLVQNLSRGLMPQGPSARKLRGRGRARGATQKAGRGRRTGQRWRTSEARVQVVPPGQEARALSGLAVHALTWTDERRDPDGHLKERLVSAASSLRVLGVIDVGRLQAMPSDQIASRFGDAGHLLMARTRGQSARPLRLFSPPTRLVERTELEQVTEDLEPILFVLRGLIERLASRLDARALSVTQVSLTFLTEPGLGHVVDLDAPRARSSKREETIALRLARPSRKAKTIFQLAQDRLSSALPASASAGTQAGSLGAVLGMRVEAVAPHADHGAQLDLFTAHEKRLEAVGALIGRLQATLGDDAVFSPLMRDTHRPEAAWSRAPFDIDAALRPAPVTRPRTVEMTTIEGQGETSAGGAPLYALPEVGEDLSVTGMASADAALGDGPADPAAKPWPKPVPREPADEPVPPLPARPSVLFSRPERATLLRSAGGLDEGVLAWRGERHHLVRLSGFERLQTEWWSSAPLERDYAVAEAGDGRRFWVFFTPGTEGATARGGGEAYVHGIFD